MGQPWDVDKIKKNLQTLAKLKSGDKFQYLSSGWIRLNSFSFRRRAEDSITHIKVYQKTEKLFETAVEFSQRAGSASRQNYSSDSTFAYVSIREIQDAYQGLRQLEGTYSYNRFDGSPPDNLIKSRSLQLILTRVKHIIDEGLTKESTYKNEVHQFREEILDRYKSRLMIGVSQHDLMSIGERGMCAVLLMDWVRRILVSGKTGFLSTSLFAPSDDVRMQNKMDKRYRPITQSYPHSKSDRAKNWRKHPIPTAEVKINPRYNRSYHRLRSVVIENEKYTSGLEARRNRKPRQGEGAEFWRHIIFRASLHASQQTDRYGIYHVELIGEINKMVFNQPIHLSHVVGFETGGLRSGHFFDPNFGEFQFNDIGGINDYCQFFDWIWRYYAVLGLWIDEYQLFHWSRQ